MTEYEPPPKKPKGMTEKRYRELYDSRPCVVIIPGARFQFGGQVTAEVVAKTYRDKGMSVTIEYA
jgi:hypothetical protein